MFINSIPFETFQIWTKENTIKHCHASTSTFNSSLITTKTLRTDILNNYYVWQLAQ